jgi:hypothetical protein
VPVASFSAAYASWRDEPFPSGSTDDVLDEIHADLVLVDTWVAESVIPFVKHGQYEPARVDVLGGIDDIRRRAVAAERSATDDGRTLAVAYETYANRLEAVYRALLAEIATGEASAPTDRT